MCVSPWHMLTGLDLVPGPWRLSAAATCKPGAGSAAWAMRALDGLAAKRPS